MCSNKSSFRWIRRVRIWPKELENMNAKCNDTTRQAGERNVKVWIFFLWCFSAHLIRLNLCLIKTYLNIFFSDQVHPNGLFPCKWLLSSTKECVLSYIIKDWFEKHNEKQETFIFSWIYIPLLYNCKKMLYRLYWCSAGYVIMWYICIIFRSFYVTVIAIQFIECLLIALMTKSSVKHMRSNILFTSSNFKDDLWSFSLDIR